MSRDTVVFESPGGLAVCKYRARLDVDVTHRNASRAISAGFVFASDAPSPSSLLLAALPHLDALAELAEGIADAPQYDKLRAYAMEHRAGDGALPNVPL